MKEILITNDDGFEADGLHALKNALNSLDQIHVTIVAPSTEKSACSHSITVTRPLSFIKLEDDFYKLDDATPADCVFLALDVLYDKAPDLIISGINKGANLAEDITYSGTCGGAMEGVLHGIPSVAFSQVYLTNSLERFGYELAALKSVQIIKQIFEKGWMLGERRLLNINFPPVSMSDFKGFRAVPAGSRGFGLSSQRNVNPRGKEYFWIGSDSLDFDASKNKFSDLGAVFDGYASITPLMLNLTAHDELGSVEKWLKG